MCCQAPRQLRGVAAAAGPGGTAAASRLLRWQQGAPCHQLWARAAAIQPTNQPTRAGTPVNCSSTPAALPQHPREADAAAVAAAEPALPTHFSASKQALRRVRSAHRKSMLPRWPLQARFWAIRFSIKSSATTDLAAAASGPVNLRTCGRATREHALRERPSGGPLAALRACKPCSQGKPARRAKPSPGGSRPAGRRTCRCRRPAPPGAAPPQAPAASAPAAVHAAAWVQVGERRRTGVRHPCSAAAAPACAPGCCPNLSAGRRPPCCTYYQHTVLPPHPSTHNTRQPRLWPLQLVDICRLAVSPSTTCNSTLSVAAQTAPLAAPACRCRPPCCPASSPPPSPRRCAPSNTPSAPPARPPRRRRRWRVPSSWLLLLQARAAGTNAEAGAGVG